MSLTDGAVRLCERVPRSVDCLSEGRALRNAGLGQLTLSEEFHNDLPG